MRPCAPPGRSLSSVDRAPSVHRRISTQKSAAFATGKHHCDQPRRHTLVRRQQTSLAEQRVAAAALHRRRRQVCIAPRVRRVVGSSRARKDSRRRALYNSTGHGSPFLSTPCSGARRWASRHARSARHGIHRDSVGQCIIGAIARLQIHSSQGRAGAGAVRWFTFPNMRALNRASLRSGSSSRCAGLLAPASRPRAFAYVTATTPASYRCGGIGST